MKEKAAESLDKELKSKFGTEYTAIDLINHCMEQGLMTPKSTEDYNIKNDFIKIKEELVKDGEYKSDLSIQMDMAATRNCSPGRIYGLTRYL